MSEEEIVPRDFVGQRIHVGDEVICLNPGYRGLNKGPIQSMGKKKATISMPSRYRGTHCQPFNALVKITDEMRRSMQNAST
jgi:hypothetical protein